MTSREIAEKWINTATVNKIHVAFTCGQFEDTASYKDELVDDIESVIRAEREACELIVLRSSGMSLHEIASAIRARSALHQPQAEAANPLFEGGGA